MFQVLFGAPSVGGLGEFFSLRVKNDFGGNGGYLVLISDFLAGGSEILRIELKVETDELAVVDLVKSGDGILDFGLTDSFGVAENE